MKNDWKKKQNIIIIVLTILILIMGVAYGILSTTLYINGISKIAAKWDIRIDSIAPLPNSTHAISKNAVVLSHTFAEYQVEFEKPGDYMEYDVVVHNYGTIDAKLSSIVDNIVDEKNYIEFTNDAVIGDYLLAGQSKKIRIKLTFPVDSKVVENGYNVKYKLDFNYVQK